MIEYKECSLQTPCPPGDWQELWSLLALWALPILGPAPARQLQARWKRRMSHFCSAGWDFLFVLSGALSHSHSTPLHSTLFCPWHPSSQNALSRPPSWHMNRSAVPSCGLSSLTLRPKNLALASLAGVRKKERKRKVFEAIARSPMQGQDSSPSGGEGHASCFQHGKLVKFYWRPYWAPADTPCWLHGID